METFMDSKLFLAVYCLPMNTKLCINFFIFYNYALQIDVEYNIFIQKIKYNY